MICWVPWTNRKIHYNSPLSVFKILVKLLWSHLHPNGLRMKSIWLCKICGNHCCQFAVSFALLRRYAKWVVLNGVWGTTENTVGVITKKSVSNFVHLEPSTCKFEFWNALHNIFITRFYTSWTWQIIFLQKRQACANHNIKHLDYISLISFQSYHH